MNNHLQFESTLPDEGKWTDQRNILEPAGKEHARLFASHLSDSIQVVRGPWNEEDYAWEFLTKCEGIKVSVLIGKDGDGDWLVTVIPVALLPFLRRRKIRLALDTVTKAIEAFVRADARFSNVRSGQE